MSASKPATRAPRRRWLQFSLRSQLVLTLACAVALTLGNVYLLPYLRQSLLAMDLEELGGFAQLEPVDTWWTRLLGKKYFRNLVGITFFDPPANHDWFARLVHA